MRYVIIGNGIAGVTAAESIRAVDPAGEMVMVSDETGPPYCRPMISMLLEGAVSAERLPIRSEKFYDTLRIETRMGERVRRIDPENRTLTIGSGRTLAFDRLLIASGADPRPIRAEGLELGNISYLRTLVHARRVERMLPGVRRALVLGGGLVGFKAAYALLTRHIPVTILIRSGYPLSMQVDRVAGEMILERMRRQGLDVHVGREVVAFEGRTRVERAHTADGAVIGCDLVVIGKGVTPALDFVPRDRIEVDLGVRVNEFLETSLPGVYAAGDAAELIDLARKRPWVNAIWPEAAIQGCIAGLNMAGRPTRLEGSLGRNVIRIFDMDVMTAGLAEPPPGDGYEVAAATCPRRGTYRKLVFREDRLVGATLVNDIEQGGILTALIRGGQSIRTERGELLDPGFNFGRLLFGKNS